MIQAADQRALYMIKDAMVWVAVLCPIKTRSMIQVATPLHGLYELDCNSMKKTFYDLDCNSITRMHFSEKLSMI